MLRAIILLQTEPSRTDSIRERLRSLDGVTRADVVSGPYDVIAEVRAPGIRELELLAGLIKAHEGVFHALTTPVSSREVTSSDDDEGRTRHEDGEE